MIYVGIGLCSLIYATVMVFISDALSMVSVVHSIDKPITYCDIKDVYDARTDIKIAFSNFSFKSRHYTIKNGHVR